MRRISRLSFFLSILSLLLVPSLSQAQDNQDDDLGGALGDVGEAYADGYVQPITDAFGANINSGLFRSADVGSGFIPGLPFNVYLGVSTSGMFISQDQESFDFEGEEIQEQGRTLTVTAEGPDGNQVPTIFGTEDPEADLVFRDEATGRVVDRQTVPAGLTNFPLAPLVMPQLGVGSIAGTDAQIRYLPSTDLSGYGSVGFTGLAVRHDVDQWIPIPLPLNLAVQGSWNQLLLEDAEGNEVLDASGWALNAQASKSVPVLPVTFYGGLQYENFGVDYGYTLTTPGGEDQTVELSQDATTNVRALAGVTLSLFVLQINADYAISNGSNVVSAGVGVRL
jgi:hypothetical protein